MGPWKFPFHSGVDNDIKDWLNVVAATGAAAPTDMHRREQEITRVAAIETVKLMRAVKTQIAKGTSKIYEVKLVFVVNTEAHVLEF